MNEHEGQTETTDPEVQAAGPEVQAADGAKKKRAKKQAQNVSFEVPAAALRVALTAAASVVPPRSPKPVIQYVLFEIVPGGVSRVTGTDMNKTVRCALDDVSGTGPCSVLIHPDKVRGILESSQAASLSFESGGPDAITVRAGKSTWRLQVEDASNYPSEHEIAADAGGVNVRVEDLKTAIRRTVFACDVDSTRYALAGCLLEEYNDGLVSLVGCDGRRLAKSVFPGVRVGGGLEIKGTVILPSPALKVLDRLSQGADATVFLSLGNRGEKGQPTILMARTGAVEIISRLTEGRFPDYSPVLKKDDAPIRATTTVAAMLSAVTQAMVVSSVESRGVLFDFQPGYGVMPPSLTLSLVSADIGSVDVPMDLDAYSGPAIKINFEGEYVREMLRVLPPAAQIIWSMESDKTQAVARAEGNFEHMLMPISI